jgi:hypothetical protein
MVVGLAVKLVMEAGGGGGVLDADPLPHPVKLARPRLRIIASGARTRRRFMGLLPPQPVRSSCARKQGEKLWIIAHFSKPAARSSAWVYHL